MFFSSFKPALSEDDDEDDKSYGANSSIRRFESSSPAFSSGIHRGLGEKGRLPTYASAPLPHGGAFTLASDLKEAPSSSLGVAPAEDEEPGSHPGDDDLDMALEADDDAEGKKDPADNELSLDPAELKILRGIINPVVDDWPSPVPKSGDK